MENRDIIELRTPLSEEDVRKLHIGDIVCITGTIYTARDVVHKFLVESESPEFKELLRNSVIYHCGPIMKKNGGWKVVSAGPTTSIREELYEADIMSIYGVRAVIGKGGMGEKTLEGLRKYGCVYLSAVGGCGASLANSINNVKNVYKLEFGTLEAIWELEVKNFPAVVTMDSHGHSLHDEITEKSRVVYERLLSAEK